MSFSPETLMAYADGELDAETRARIEAAMASDPAVAQQVEKYRAMRAELTAAFDDVLAEPIPPRLLDTAGGTPHTSTVTDLAAARAAKARREPARGWSWPQWSSMAASLLIGVLAGRFFLQPSADLFTAGDDGIVAAGALARALSEQVGGSAGEVVNIGASFRAQSGEYCRTFVGGDSNTFAGFACYEAGRWNVGSLARHERGAASESDYRMAGTELPPSVRIAIEETMEGEALDVEEEREARERGWQ